MITFVCPSICAPHHLKTITSIKLKFGGQIFHVVQTDSSKFGFYLFGVLRHFQYCTGHITTGS